MKLDNLQLDEGGDGARNDVVLMRRSVFPEGITRKLG
jgi:hypothetical protein